MFQQKKGNGQSSVRPFRSTGFSALLVLVLITGLLSACGSKSEVEGEAQKEKPTTEASTTASSGTAVSEENTEQTKGERTVKDDLGHDVIVPEHTERVFAPYLEDSLLTLGVKPVAQWASGTQGHVYLKDQLSGVPTLDFSSGLPSPEALMAYNPDFIILHTAQYAENGVYESYSKIAPTYVFTNASGDVEKSLQVIGDLLGKTAEAEKAIATYHAKVDDAKAKLAKVTEGKKAAIIRFAPRGISMMGGNYFSGYVVYQQLGLGKPTLVQTENSATVSTEVLPEIDADFIFTVEQGPGSMKEMTDTKVWNSMPAVKAGNVYAVEPAPWLGGGLIAYGHVIDDTLKALTQ
ncbi:MULTISPECIES: ABC transporter substrate-binding protein [unclassified Paenibacillus]|uniref:ABC transporter substrate-binding protein n=1 Tax=unclassified Paenibacillus TaxID=185978 RepID=UPI0009A81CCB|nr:MULTISPECIES: ABC transporter substrate-binding protein [unclassified Paenibacillus]SLK21245.1 iron complex transport system substrate-binding protein [Paenibacillus sp. RU5A]SOC76524.1 iron complex transport system substrate-binding protein [Paenibacillus sp. RU26A]SOC78006.1 iron complex transport system substrate-binding protein [Paenibacillus sp. RU5M]